MHFYWFPTSLCGVLVLILYPASSAAAPLSHTQLCHTPSVTHTTLSHTPSFTHKFITHHLFRQLCHTPSFTPNFVRHNYVTPSFAHNFVTHTHHLSHPTLSDTTLSHTICHTHNFVTHTTLSHTIFHTQFCRGRRGSCGNGLALVARFGALGRRWRRGTLRGRCGTWRHWLAFCKAGVALGDIHLHFAWQAWHLAGSTFTLRSRRGSDWHLPSFCVAHVGGWLWWRAWARLVAGDAAVLCVAGVALGDIHLRFAWQVWHLVTSSLVSRGRCGTWRHPPSLRVAGVALVDIYLGFAWQVWHLRHWAGSGGTLGRAWSPVTPRYFASQAWHLATSTFVSRGRRGTWRHPPSRGRRGPGWRLPSFCVAGVALAALGWLWWRALARLVAGDAAVLCVAGMALGVAGVALGDIHLHFAWQAWHLVWSTFTLRWDLATSTWNLPSLCVAGVERSWSYAGTFTFWKRCWHVFACFALAQRGKRPCACLIKTFWKRCWHVFQEAAHCIHVLYYPGQVLFSSFMVVEPVAVGQAWLSSEFVVVSVSFSMLLI